MIGTLADIAFYSFSKPLGYAMEYGLQQFRKNMVTFTFTAIMLGLCCRRRGVNISLYASLEMVLHEGLPMLIYSQILTWGQTTICLLLSILLTSGLGVRVPLYLPAMVPLGLEAESDVYPSHYPSGKYMWSQHVVEDAEAFGIHITCVIFVLLLSFRTRIVNWLDGLTGGAKDGISSARDQPGGAGSSPSPHHRDRETFGAGRRDRKMSRSESDPSLLAQEEGTARRDAASPSNGAPLGTHISIIAVVSCLAFVCTSLFRALGWTFIYRHLRMFKLGMFLAMIIMNVLVGKGYVGEYSNVKLRRDWFMRLGAYSLDMVVIAAISVGNFRKPQEPLSVDGKAGASHTWLTVIFVLACVGWNIYCFCALARYAFPNFWLERAVTLSGDCLGHSYLGLLFARTLDPMMETPVPTAYLFKLMLFFIPSTAEKNTIMCSLMERYGQSMALAVACTIVVAWLLIHERFFSGRFIHRGRMPWLMRLLGAVLDTDGPGEGTPSPSPSSSSSPSSSPSPSPSSSPLPSP